MSDRNLLPPPVLFVDTDIDAEARRHPHRKLWKASTATTSASGVCPLYNALVDNKYRIREQILTLDLPHAFFWTAVDIEKPEGQNQVLLQTFRPQHDLGENMSPETANRMAKHQLEMCSRHKAQFDKFLSKDDDRWEFLSSTLHSTTASEPRGRRILLVAPRRIAPGAPITYDKNNEISSRIHYIARDLCSDRILCTTVRATEPAAIAAASASNKWSNVFSKPVAQYFIRQLVIATKLCHQCKIFQVVPGPKVAGTAKSSSSDSIASEILLFRQQGCYHLKLMLGDSAEILEEDATAPRRTELQNQDLNYIAQIYCNILIATDKLTLEDCRKFVQEQYDAGDAKSPTQSVPRFVKAQAILEMETALQQQLPTPVILPAKKDVSAVRDHIKDLVQDEFRSFQKRMLEESGADGGQPSSLAALDAIRLCQLPPMNAGESAEDNLDFLYAVKENTDSSIEMIALVAPREPLVVPADSQHMQVNKWSDMIVRFRLSEVPIMTSGSAASQQMSTQTQIEAWHMSGQTIDAWNNFKYALSSRLLKKSNEEIKRDMLINTEKLLDALKKAIQTPEEMTDDDINGLTAHIACMMAYTEAVKGGSNEKDSIRSTVGKFNKRFNAAWRCVVPIALRRCSYAWVRVCVLIVHFVVVC